MRILFFASLRDHLGTSEMPFSLADGQSLSADDLRDRLIAEHPEWQGALTQPSLLIAVNQKMANWQTLLNQEDEVALFPPVTGG